MQTIFRGVVIPGYQIASGQSVGTEGNPFSAGSLATQAPLLAKQGIDLETLVPGLFWGTINVELKEEIVLIRSDYQARDIDWTVNEIGAARIPPETFSFVRCCFAYPAASTGDMTAYYPGLLYYPHPETKPGTNAHHYDRLEVITPPVPNLVPGTIAEIVCRADAFGRR